MTSESKAPITVASAQSFLRAAGARALASALVTGIDHAEQEDHPLTQEQQIDLATMTVMAYDEILKGADLILIEARLRAEHEASQ